MPTASTVPYGATQATTVIGAGGALPPIDPGAPGEQGEPEGKKKRSKWFWPLIAIIVVLAVVLGGLIYSFVSGNTAPEPKPTTPASISSAPPSTPPPTPSNTPTPTPTSNTVAIPEAELKGKTFDEAAALLKALDYDLGAKSVTGSAAPGADQVGRVYKVNPVGNVQRGTEVELTVYGPLPTVNSPTTAPTLGSVDWPGTKPTQLNVVPVNGAYNVNWNAYSCPSGTTLDHYTVTATNATVNAEPGTATTASLTSTSAGPVTVAYSVTCSGIQSGSSPSLNVTAISAPTATPPNG
jgi:serine/threonine-protein kinase